MTPNLDRLRNVPLFALINDEQFDQLKQSVITRKYGKHNPICYRGDYDDKFYFIDSGSVKVSITNDDGKEMILAVLTEGEYFGEMSLIDGQPRSADVETREVTTLHSISKEDFDRIFTTDKAVTINLLKETTHRLREADKKIESLAMMDVYQRIARTFDSISILKDGKRFVERRITHQDIANMVAASRERVSKIMKTLEQSGYISKINHIICINKKLPYRF